MIHKGSRYPRKISKGGREVHWLTKGGRTIYMSPAAAKAASKAWLDANVVTTAVVEEDAFGRWFELEVTLPDTFDGNATDGWTDGTISLGLFWSDNLTSWLGAGNGWVDAPGKTPEDLGDRIKWFARFETAAIIRYSATIDHRLTCARVGKTITAVSVLGSAVTLPNFPYDIPADITQLQTDLVAAGFTGATVTNSTGSWLAEIRNYDKGGEHGGNPVRFVPTWSGADITALANATAGGTTVSLPNFPYTMPGDESLLEADLVAAGFTYAQVTLYKDEWEIFIPDLVTTGAERRFEVTITPSDPMQLWTYFGTDNGINPQTLLTGQVENVRIGGAGADEALRAFARVGFINIPTI